MPSPGPGSVFHFTVAFGLQKASAALNGQQGELKGKRVLVVDDNAANRRILDHLLTHSRMEAEMASGGLLALEMLAEANAVGRPFALVLLDANMPDMDGFETASRIVQNPELAGTTVMMLSSADQQRSSARCREIGIATYLIKPIRPNELLAAMRAALGVRAVEESNMTTIAAGLLIENANKTRVLIAEDNVVNQKLALRQLQQLGYRADLASNGIEAIECIERQPYDLVLMDVQMPEMDGLEASRRITRRWPAHERPRIVAMTANAMHGDREECMAAGMDDYVTKPIRVEQLIESLALTASRSDA